MIPTGGVAAKYGTPEVAGIRAFIASLLLLHGTQRLNCDGSSGLKAVAKGHRDDQFTFDGQFDRDLGEQGFPAGAAPTAARTKPGGRWQLEPASRTSAATDGGGAGKISANTRGVTAARNPAAWRAERKLLRDASPR